MVLVVVALLGALLGVPASAQGEPLLEDSEVESVGVVVVETGVPPGTVVSEDGSSLRDGYSLVLGSEPAGDVVVSVVPGVGVEVDAPGGDVVWVSSSVDVVFTVSDWDAPQVVAVRGVDDLLDNPGDERSVEISHGVSSGDAVFDGIDAASVLVTVVDDDDAPSLVVLSADVVSVSEGVSGGSQVVEVTASVVGATRFAGDRSVSVSVGASGDSAVSGVDFEAVGDFVVVIPAGEVSGSGSFSLVLVDDGFDEAVESVTVSGALAGSGAVSGVSLEIVDDDEAPVVSVVDAVAVAEGDDPEVVVPPVLGFTVSLSVVSGRDVVVSYGLGGTAVSGVDYVSPDVLSVTVPAGEASAEVAVAVIGDSAVEVDETVTVVLTGAVNASVSTVAGTATGVITNDDTDPNPDPEPQPEVDPEPDPDPDPQPEVDPDPVLDPDPEPELDPETDPQPDPDPETDPQPDPDPETDPVLDPDPDPGAAAGVVLVELGDLPGTVVSEDGVSLTDAYSVVLASAPLSPVTVAVSPGAGVEVDAPGGDVVWVSSSVDVVFTVADWDVPQVVAVRGVDDLVAEPGGARSVEISHAVSSGDAAYDGIGVVSVLVLVIEDGFDLEGLEGDALIGVSDETAVTVRFSTGAALSVDERDDTSTSGTREDQVMVTVALSADPGRSVTVPLTVMATGRANEADYSGVPDNVVFASGETSKSFVFSALDDSVVDEAEVVTIGFGVLPSGVTAGDPAATVVSIVDDDRRVLQAHMADERTSPNGPTDNGAAPDYSSVGGIDAGDWLRFYNVSFDEAPDVLMVSLAAAAAGGTIEVRLDSTTGPKVATLTIASTGSSSRFGVQYASVSGISAGSTRDVFFVFPSATGANVNWFVFGEDPAGETTAEFDERMRWWRDAKFGQFIHWGAYSQLEGVWKGCKYAEWIMLQCPMKMADYEREAAAKLVPTAFDAKEWARRAREAGQKYVVITSKHHDGFSMFDTDVRGFEAKSCGTGRDYDVVDHTAGSCAADPGWGRDPLVELAEAVRAEGLKFAVYYSQWDWHYRFGREDVYWNLKAGSDWAGFSSLVGVDDYMPAMREQMRELVEKLDPALFWFDGEWNPPWTAEHGKELYKFMRVLSPDAIINDRVGTRRLHLNGVGDYDTVAEHRGPTYVWSDWENSQTMTKRWGYASHDTEVKPHSQFAEELFANVSRDGNYLLNVSPTGTGALTQVNKDGLTAIGGWLDTHGSAVFDVTRPNPLRFYIPSWGRYVTGADESTVYAGVYTWPATGQLTLEYLDASVTKAVLLNDPDTEYNFHTINGQTIVTGLPATAPDGVLLPVLVLSVEGELKTQAGTNLALDHKTAEASDVHQDPIWNDADWYTAERAFDGSIASRWLTKNKTTSFARAAAPTLTLTLKKSQTFNRIELREYDASVVRGFVIQYHNGTSWVDLHTGTRIGDSGFLKINFTAVTSDRLRLLITSKTSAEDLTIAEFAIYNAPTTTISNLASGRPVTASSTWPTSGNLHTADKVTDGDTTTRWSASSGNRTGNLTVTFASTQTFNSAIIKEPTDTRLQRVTGFKIQYHDGTNWVDADTGTDTGTSIGTSREIGFTPVSSDRVRLAITGASGGEPTISEFEVYNKPARGVLAGFAEASYEVTEGASATVTVKLSDAPGRSVMIPLTVTYTGGASAADHTSIPASLTFAAGESSKTFTVSAVDDDDDDDGESLTITLGTLPAAVSTWNNRAAKIPITDNDDPPTAGATFTPSSVSVAENSGEASYTVVLDLLPTATVTVALSVSGPVKIDGPDPATTFEDTETLTFTTTNWDRPQTVEVQGQNDALENPGGGRSATITHDFSSSDTAYNALVDGVVPVTVTDDDQAKVFFSSASTLSVAESDDPSTSGTREDQTTVTVALSRDPGRSVTVPLTVTATGRANEADYSGVPESVVFASGETSKSFVFDALDDTVVDEYEKVTIGFGTLPSVVIAGDPAETEVFIVDDDRRVLQAHMADERTSPNGPTDNGAAPDYSSVGGIDAGDYLRFNNVKFAEAPDILMVSLAASSADAGDRIEVRLGSASGTRVANLTIASTGNRNRFGVQYASVSQISAGSTHDLFFVFPSATGANINWFVFGEDPDDETTSEFDERMRWWRDAKFGQFIHWGAYSQLEGYWGDQPADADKCKDAEWIMIRCKISLSEYEREAAAKLNPSDFNAKEWARKAKEAGQKYVVITSKHHDGFSMFDTNVRGFQAKSCGTGRDYDVVDHTTGSCSDTSNGSGWGRDPLVELAEAVRAEGLKFAVYYSQWDWHYRFLRIGRYGGGPGPGWSSVVSPEDHLPAMREQLRELVEKLDPALFWFDGEWNPPWSAAHGRELYKFMRVLSPDAIINDRVGTRKIHKNGVGDYDTVAEHRGPTYVWPDWENSQTMTARWGYTRHDTDMKPHSQFAEELFANVSRNGNYLLNVAPTETGALTKVNVDGLVAVGAWLDTHGSAVFDVLKPNPLRPYVPPWGYYTTGKDKSTVYAGVYTWPSNGQLTLEYLDATVIKAVLLSDPDTEYNFHTINGQTIVTGLPASAPAGVLLPVLALSVVGEPKTQAGANLALDHKTVTGSPAAHQDPGYPDADWFSAERAFDGSLASRWVIRNTRTSWSRAAAPTLTLTLKQSQTFNRIELRELNNAVVQSFVIQYHNGTNWVDLHTGTTIGISEFHKIDFAPVTSDRLRLLITSKTSHAWLNIAEFAIYNVPTITSLAYGRSVATDSSRGMFVNSNVVDGDDTTYWHASSGSTTGHLTVRLDGVQVFDRVVLKEPAGLRRVTGFKVQYRKGGAWVDLHTGTTIGASLEVVFAPVSSGRVRLLITGASDSPAVSEFEVWNEARGVLAGFAESSYSVVEGGAAVSVTVELSDAPDRSVTVPLVVTYSGGAVAGDASGIPASVTFAANETSKTFMVTAVDDTDDDDGEGVVIALGALPLEVAAWSNRSVMIPITDDDTAAVEGVSFSSSSVSVAEKSGEASYTVVLDSRPTADVTVALSVSGPVKIDGPDPATTFKDTETLTFTTTNWDMPQTVRVQGQDDVLDNPGDERAALITHAFTSSDSGYGALDDEDVSVAVSDEDAAPSMVVLSVDADVSTTGVVESSVAEGGGAKTVRVTATVSGSTRFGADQSVTLRVGASSDSAIEGTDYLMVPDKSFLIAAGAVSGSTTFTLTPVDDDDVESAEVLSVIGVLSGVAFQGATVGITDDDTAGLVLSHTTRTVTENSGTASYTVKLATRPSADVTVALSVSGPVLLDGPDNAADFTGGESLTFTRTNWGTAQTVRLQGVNDDLRNAGGSRSAMVTHDVSSSSDTVYNALTDKMVSVTVTDDDPKPTIRLSVDADTSTNGDQSSVVEGAGVKTVRVTATVDGAKLSDRVVVSVAVGDTTDTAAEGADYTTVAVQEITIAAEAASGGTTFMLTPTDDDFDEPVQSLSIEGTLAGFSVTGTSIAITDNDATPTIALSVSPTSVVESTGATSVEVTATIGGSVRFDEARTVAVSVAGSGVAGRVGFAPVSGFDITIPADTGSAGGSFTLTPTPNSVDEDDETVTVSGTVSGTPAVSATSAMLMLTDDDGAGLVLSHTTRSVSESAGAASYTVKLASRPTATVTVMVSATGPVLLDGPDSAGTFTASESLTFTTDTWATAQTVNLRGQNDSLVNSGGNREAMVTHVVSTTTDQKYSALSGRVVTVTVTDDETVPEIMLSVAPATVVEGNGATPVAVTATIGGSVRFDAARTVAVTVTGSSVAGRVGFMPVTGFNITIAKGASSGSESFTLTPAVDQIDEDDETVTVSGSVSGTPAATATSAMLMLTDDDVSGLVLSHTTRSVSENAGAASYTVKLATRPSASVSVMVSATGPVLLDGPDSATVFTNSETLTFTTSNWATAQTVNLQGQNDILDNTGDERSATVTHAVSTTTDSKYSALTDSDVTVTVTDDDAAPSVIELSVDADTGTNNAEGSVAENVATAKTARVTATIKSATRFGVSKDVAVTVGADGDSATEGTDYATVGPLTIMIPAGKASGYVDFMLDPMDDNFAEGTQSLSIKGTLTGVMFTDTSIDIVDDEMVPTISLTVTDTDTATNGMQTSVAEDGGQKTVQVTATIDGSARFDADRIVTVSVAGSGTPSAVDFTDVTDFDITISADTASGTETFVLMPTDDNVDETDETINITGASTGPPMATVMPASFMLTDDDDAPSVIELSVDADTGTNGDQTEVDENVSDAKTARVTATITSATRFATDKDVMVTVGADGDSATEGTDYATVGALTITIPAGEASGYVDFTLDPMDDNFAEGTQSLSITGELTDVMFTDTSIDITDDEMVPTIALAVTDTDTATNGVQTTVAEDGGQKTVLVTATIGGTVRFEEARTVTVTVAGSSTPSAVDFTAVPDFDITIPANTDTGTRTFVLTPDDDNVDETDETINITGASTGPPMATVMPASFMLTDDDDAPSAVTLSVDADTGTNNAQTSVAENAATAKTARVTATITSATRFATDKDVMVTVGADGDSATEGTDYATVGALTITIPAGEASGYVDFTLDPMDDNFAEGTQSLSITGELTDVMFTDTSIDITDDEMVPTIALAVTDTDTATNGVQTTVAEDGGQKTVLVTATIGGTVRFEEARTVTVTVAGSSTPSAVDFTDVTNFDITIPANTDTGTRTFVLTPDDDNVDETDETINITGASTGPPMATVMPASFMLTDDDDAPSVIELSVDADTGTDGVQTEVAEDDGAKTVRVTATITSATRFATDQSVSVTVGDSDDDAVEGMDYATVGALSITIPAGEVSGFVEFVLTPTDDSLVEATQSLSITGALAGVTVEPTKVGIVDDEAVPGITLSVAPVSAGESDGGDDGMIEVRVTAMIDTTARFDVDRVVVVSVAGSDTAGVVGFTAVEDFDVTIPAGDGSSSEVFDLVPTADRVDDENESVTVSGMSTGPPEATVSSVVLSLVDDDTAGVVVSETTRTVAEESGTVVYTVVLTSDPTADVTVTVTSGDGGIVVVDGSDSGTTGSVSESLVFNPTGGAAPWNVAQTVTVSGVDNDIDDTGDQRTATITHTVTSTDAKYSGFSPVGSVDVTVTDEDGAGLGVSVSSLIVTESGAGSYTVRLDSEPVADVTVALSTVGAVLLDGPDSSEDFTNSETLTFTASGAKAWNVAQTVRVQGQNDDLDNTGNKRTASITHDVASTDSKYSAIADRVLAVTVTDDDDTPEISLSLDQVSIAENAAAADTVVTVTATVAGSVRFDTVKTVRVTVAGPDGDEYVDFSPPTAFDIEIAAQAATGTASFVLTPIDDQVDETDAVVTVSGASAGLVVNEASLRLTDDESPPIIALAAPLGDTVTEGDPVEFTLVATVASSVPLTVNLAVSETGAGDHVDADNQGQKTVVLPAYATRVVYRVATVDDSTAEAAGTVTVTLRSGTGYSVAVSNRRNVTVTDDDTPAATAVTLTTTSSSVTEGDNLTVTVTLATAAAAHVTIPVTTVPGTAAAADYTAPASIAVAAGQTIGTAALTATDDSNDEPSETLTLSLGTLPTGYTAGTPSSVTVTITDDDATTVTLARDTAATLTEGETLDHTLTLARGLVAGESVSVPLVFNSGNAAATRGSDYTLACEDPLPTGVACNNLDSGAAMVVFTGPSAASVTVTVTAAADDTTETGGETVNIGLGTPVVSGLDGGTTTADTAAGFTIEDPPPGVAVTLAAANNGTVTEGSNLTVTVTLAAAATADVVIPVTVVNATTTNTDHSLSAASVTVTSGTTSGTVTLTATNDSSDEPSETLTLSLGTLPTGYTTGTPNSVTVTIVDDDATTVTLARDTGATLTEGETLDHTLTLARGLVAGESLSVPLVFNSGTGAATRGSDYTLACENPLPAGVACNNLDTDAATVVFTGPSTDTVTVTVTATADDITETGETVNIGLGTPVVSGLDGSRRRNHNRRHCCGVHHRRPAARRRCHARGRQQRHRHRRQQPDRHRHARRRGDS